MTNQHPITPPPELVQQWINEEDGLTAGHIATQAARWGADQELEACVEWLEDADLDDSQKVSWVNLRAARRPKPPTLKEQALTALYAIATGANDTREQHQDFDTVRRALEALPND
jgi:hypothetical protein